MNIEDYETRMVHDGKRNNREVKINCERCDAESWVRWQRVRSGKGRFCSLDCFNEFQIEEGKRKWGVENARFHWNKSLQCWCAYWYNETTGRLQSTTKARWLWNTWMGLVPDKHVVTYIDGDPENCELDNLEIISRADWNKIHLIGHEVSDETKQKLSIAHKGKILSDDHKRKIGLSVSRRWREGEFESIHVGSSNPRWKGGVKFLVYPKEFDDKLRQLIRKRDNHECQTCRKSVYRSRYGHVHHIDGNKNNNIESNLVLICASCHSIIHGRNNIRSDKINEYRSKLK